VKKAQPSRHHKVIHKKVAVAIIPDSMCIAAVGDIMLGTSYPDSTTLPPDSAKNSFMAVEKYLRQADVTFGNLEGTLLDAGMPAPYKMHLKTKAYLFRMPVRCGMVLKDAGFKVVSIANNHIGDFGDNGRLSTMKTLDSCGIYYGGLLIHPSAIFTVNGVKYGFCSFAPNSQTEPILDLRAATQLISDLKKQCDVVIVSFHGGAEGVGFEHVPFKMESYFNEKRGNVHAFAHNAIDAGADLILGNGPHVSRAMELYKNRLIAYSLGNFCTYKSVSVDGVCGMAPILKVNINKKGEFLSGQIISCQQTHNNGLMPDTLNRAAARIKWLTEKDFPKAGLSISEDGLIVKNMP
jgi:poly-gamma-glutamate capsule biosynthesis protein CapA/YwtB (metallophosphatase superfamily)